MMRQPVLVSALAIGIACLAPSPAQAQQGGTPPAPAAQPGPVTAEVIVLYATNDGTGIDPKIGKMPQLGKPPFSSYNSYKLLGDRTKLSLAKGQAVTTTLPNSRVMQVTLKNILAPQKKGEPT